MPKFKQPKTLEDLSIEALVKRVSQKAREAIDTGTHISSGDLNDYLYAELPRVLSDRVTTRMLPEVVGSLANQDYGNNNVRNVAESIILAITYRDISCLKLTGLPWYAVQILSCCMAAFNKLCTLSFDDNVGLPNYVMETLPICFSFFKSLVYFRMNIRCTDAIINSLGSSCSGTIEHIHIDFCDKVTDASFKILSKFAKLKHLSICNTSMRAEGFAQFLRRIQQHKKSDDTAKDFLHVGVGSKFFWEVSTTQLNEIAISCPKLKELVICNLRGDLEALVSLTTLEALGINDCDFHTCNFEGFLRLRGSNLISLGLHRIFSMDLRYILIHCVNIKRLHVSGGNVMDLALGDTEDAAKALQSLEDLHIKSLFERMLYACVNVKRLTLHLDHEIITDEFILLLLSHNPLQKLTSFAANSPMLTMKSVNAIIDHCPLLEELECVWGHSNAISDFEIKCLRQRVADKNQDLQITFSGEIIFL